MSWKSSGVPFPLFNENMLGILPNDPDFFKAECLHRSREIEREAANIISQPNGAFLLWQTVYWFHLFLVDSADALYQLEANKIIENHKAKVKGEQLSSPVYVEDAQLLYRVIQKFLVRQKWKVVPREIIAFVPDIDEETFQASIQTAQNVLNEIDKAEGEAMYNEIAKDLIKDEISIVDALKRIKVGTPNEIVKEVKKKNEKVSYNV